MYVVMNNLCNIFTLLHGKRFSIQSSSLAFNSSHFETDFIVASLYVEGRPHFSKCWWRLRPHAWLMALKLCLNTCWAYHELFSFKLV